MVVVLEPGRLLVLGVGLDAVLLVGLARLALLELSGRAGWRP